MSPQAQILDHLPKSKSSFQIVGAAAARPDGSSAGPTPSPLRAGRYYRVKRLVDGVGASLLLVLLSPLILVCAIVVRLTSRGPAIYTQTRLGQGGKPFRIYKLRSMSHNCETASGARWATRNDPRVTRIGKLLRITHLDELPQLFNILKGDMSLVGPRPERPEFIPVLEAAIPHYRQRLLVKPGVTGLAQVYLPPDTGIDSVKRKLLYDLTYLRRLSFWLDLRLMMATPLQAAGLPPVLVRRLLWLPSPRSIELPATRMQSPRTG